MSDDKWGLGNAVSRDTTDQAFEALANEHRRRLLVALLERNPQEEALNGVHEGVRKGEAKADSLEIEMHHTHLPKLKEAGFIEWDSDKNQVVTGRNFDVIKPVLEILTGSRVEG